MSEECYYFYHQQQHLKLNNIRKDRIDKKAKGFHFTAYKNMHKVKIIASNLTKIALFLLFKYLMRNWYLFLFKDE